jgi:hypothetical protein
MGKKTTQPLRKVIYDKNNIEFVQYANGSFCAERIENNCYQEIRHEELVPTARTLGIYGNWKRCETFNRWELIA